MSTGSDDMMVLRTVAALRELDSRRQEGPLVLVPTMGALHEGHLSLVRQGAELGPVVVSIFVNPTQFGPNEDFQAYPRTLEADLEMLRPLGVRAVFAPDVSEVYGPAGAPTGVTVQPGFRAAGLCGADRPGHFAGVLTVVAKLFGMVRPDVAIFGRKDAQQCLVIRQMVEDLHLPVRLVDGPTVREPDGLAMSSRNRYLEAPQRRQALCLVRALRRAEEMLAAGERRAHPLREAMLAILAEADAAEYAEIRQVPDLDPPETLAGTILLAVAARVGPARLIDNFVLEVNDEGTEPGFLLGTGKDIAGT